METLINIINIIRINNGMSKIDNLSSDTTLREDLRFDSLDLAELTVRCESEFNVDIFENGIVNTIGEVKKIINE